MASFYWQGSHYTDWSQKTAWVTTSGGSSHPSNAPTVTDNVYFESATSVANCSINTTTCYCKYLNINNNYTGTISFSSTSNKLICGNNGTLTFGTGATYSATNAGTVTSTITTLTTNGMTIPWKFNFAATDVGTVTLSATISVGAITFADSCSFSGAYSVTCTGFTVSNANEPTITLTGNVDCNGDMVVGNSATLINGAFTISVSGNLTCSTTVGGTTSITMDGTGTIDCGGSDNTIANSLTINTAGTITIDELAYAGGVLTYTGGTMAYTGAKTLYLMDSCSIATSSMTWYNVSGYSGTITLTSSLYISNTLYVMPDSGVTINSNSVYVGGDFLVEGEIYGNSTIILNGTGTWSGNGDDYVMINLTINTAGTITISGTVQYLTKTLTYTAGTVIATGSTLDLQGGATLNISGVTLNNITFTIGDEETYTITTGFALIGTFTVLDNCTLANCALTGPPTTISIASGKTLTTTTFSIASTAAHRTTLSGGGTISKSSGSITLTYCDITNVSATGGAVFNANSRTNTFTKGALTGWMVPNQVTGGFIAITNN